MISGCTHRTEFLFCLKNSTNKVKISDFFILSDVFVFVSLFCRCDMSRIEQMLMIWVNVLKVFSILTTWLFVRVTRMLFIFNYCSYSCRCNNYCYRAWQRQPYSPDPANHLLALACHKLRSG